MFLRLTLNDTVNMWIIFKFVVNYFNIFHVATVTTGIIFYIFQ